MKGRSFIRFNGEILDDLDSSAGSDFYRSADFSSLLPRLFSGLTRIRMCNVATIHHKLLIPFDLQQRKPSNRKRVDGDLFAI